MSKSNDEITLKRIVREKYAGIALANQSKGCCGPDTSCDPEISFIGDDYQDKEGYVAEADLGLGCGLPTEFAMIKPGDTVVDLGSGAGNDCFIARAETGSTGKVIGLDFTPEMIAKARENADKLGYDNVKFVLGDIDNNPIEDNIADVVVSNCVFNLIPNRTAAFRETLRILKPGAHFSISDVVLVGALPDDLRSDAELYAGCVSGAMQRDEYLQLIEQVGFTDIKVQKERQIDIPTEILKRHISDDTHVSWVKKEVGIFSITVFARKPA